jgi:hypothetical protein
MHVSYVYFICCGNEGASSSASDVDRYVSIIKLLEYVFSILPVFRRQWETQTCLHRIFFGKTAYTTCDVPGFIVWRDFN